MRNRAGSFSVERLEITVRPTRKPQGMVSVVA
jgi:hypothetical protein